LEIVLGSTCRPHEPSRVEATIEDDADVDKPVARQDPGVDFTPES
jgi:hypothetical protein